MRIIASDAVCAVIYTTLKAAGLDTLAHYIDTLRVADLSGADLWRYDAASRVLTLSVTLFEDDAVPLCQTDEQVQAAQRQVALEQALAEVQEHRPWLG
jgi:hypothetical protein